MGIVKYYITILLKKYVKGPNSRSKLLRKWKEMGGLKGAMDSSFAQKRKGKETEWIKKLQMVYPYGMND